MQRLSELLNRSDTGENEELFRHFGFWIEVTPTDFVTWYGRRVLYSAVSGGKQHQESPRHLHYTPVKSALASLCLPLFVFTSDRRGLADQFIARVRHVELSHLDFLHMEIQTSF
ncbi:hypothetical protein BaRGS_00021470 [Batillaria attramentaria]|uniref:Uncharacterized protein n=1 Tax=Batillaria attramentaria TaxID=370345 RepID=A0ABD0KJU7_9CAEN